MDVIELGNGRNPIVVPREWYLRVQKGITAGLAPPTPSAIHILAKSEADSFIKIVSVVKPFGKGTGGSEAIAPLLDQSAITELQNPAPVQLTLPLYPSPIDESSTAIDRIAVPPSPNILLLIDEMHTLLKVLPTELPRGSEDIYKSDVGLVWKSKNLDWCNMNMLMVEKGTPGTEGFNCDEMTKAIEALDTFSNDTSSIKASFPSIPASPSSSATTPNHLNSGTGIGIGGSGGYISIVKASDDEKRMFRRVLEIVDILLDIANGKMDPEAVIIRDMIEEIRVERLQEEAKVEQDVTMKETTAETTMKETTAETTAEGNAAEETTEVSTAMDDDIMEIDGAEWKGKKKEEVIPERVAKRAATENAAGPSKSGRSSKASTKKSTRAEVKMTRTSPRKKKGGN